MNSKLCSSDFCLSLKIDHKKETHFGCNAPLPRPNTAAKRLTGRYRIMMRFPLRGTLQHYNVLGLILNNSATSAPTEMGKRAVSYP
jgi:hypothetical protein